MKAKTKNIMAGYGFILPSLCGFSLLYLIPFITSISYCFTEGMDRSKFVWFKNFIELVNNGSYILAVKNTLRFNIIAVPLIMAGSLILALILNIKIKGRNVFRALSIVPLVVPVGSVVLVWQILFDQYGPLNHFLEIIKIQPVDYMRSGWSVLVLILIYTWKNCGYNVVLFLAGLNNIPREYYEAANVDGAGKLVCFFKITLPCLAPTAFFVFIISIINSFKVFREAYLLFGSYPDTNTYMLQHFMNNNFFSLSYQRLTTAAFIMAALVSSLVYILFRIENKLGNNII